MKINLNKFIVGITIAFFGSVFLFCLFYLLAPYHFLVEWYRNLEPCFYRKGAWTNDFFTPGVKANGNIYCIISICISLLVLLGIASKRMKLKDIIGSVLLPKIQRVDTPIISLIFFWCSGLWLWGNHLALPAYDEVFSAQNAAGIHPFQCISYYMLPNNHMFYNLVNNLLFHFFSDKVITGRLISLFAYFSTICAIYFWIKNYIRNSWLTLMFCFTISVQFQVWGFSFQARGYELYLLTEILCFISCVQYFIGSKPKWLFVNIIATGIGYFIIPTFLYVHVVQVMVAVFSMLINRNFDRNYWYSQLISITLIFMLYIPAFCFSGADAITNNHYVGQMSRYKTIPAFLDWFLPYFLPYLNHLFAGVEWKIASIPWVLLFMPLLLIFDWRNRLSKQLLFYYLFLWVAFFTTVIIMKRPPFERNLIGHYCITFICFFWLVYRIVQLLVPIILFKMGQINGNRYANIMFFLLSTGFIYICIVGNLKLLKDTLYEYDVNKSYIAIDEGVKILDKNSKIGFTDEGFYCLFICKRKGMITEKCNPYQMDYLIKQEGETIPSECVGQYVIMQKGLEYELYQKKK